jgi:Zn finger protein HypA/HybF involved in hydrogenase expression
MNERVKEEDLRKTEVRCDLCRKTFAASAADKPCPECKIGRVRIMKKAA